VFSALADVAQIIYLDHRGNGRSGGDDPKTSPNGATMWERSAMLSALNNPSSMALRLAAWLLRRMLRATPRILVS
jgi:hypothetical protein